ncbi:UNVERIFIED_CONTAM: hypothetical protein H355_009464 [Colinus virginianus]|nr:hypothetical protein H355_009464 [Colinus virginianus]
MNGRGIPGIVSMVFLESQMVWSQITRQQEARAPIVLAEILGVKGYRRGWKRGTFILYTSLFSSVVCPTGISWFVQAEDSKFESRKENCSSCIPHPGPSWFEPFTNTKPWREPLREKNFQEQQCSKVTQPAVPEREAETGPTRPFVKLTLQEALAMRRPDFIFRSGERVKHLKLVMEERRIQSVLQTEREELFNPPEKRKGYRNANHVLSDRGTSAFLLLVFCYLIKEKRRAIPKSEMVRRSKRIYEQLPEVQKKREEEKRKSEYNSYRLKAQLYKMGKGSRVSSRKLTEKAICSALMAEQGRLWWSRFNAIPYVALGVEGCKL